MKEKTYSRKEVDTIMHTTIRKQMDELRVIAKRKSKMPIESNDTRHVQAV